VEVLSCIKVWKMRRTLHPEENLKKKKEAQAKGAHRPKSHGQGREEAQGACQQKEEKLKVEGGGEKRQSYLNCTLNMKTVCSGRNPIFTRGKARRERERRRGDLKTAGTKRYLY